MAAIPDAAQAKSAKALEEAKNDVFEIFKEMRGRLVGLQIIGQLDTVAGLLTQAVVAHVTGHPMYIVQQPGAAAPKAMAVGSAATEQPEQKPATEKPKGPAKKE